MSILGFVLVAGTALALWIPFLRRLTGGLPRWLDFVPAALLVLMLVQIMADGLQPYMLVIYALVVLTFLGSLRRLIRPNLPTKASRLRTVLSLLGTLLGTAGLICGIVATPMIAIGAGDDLSGEDWTKAFDHMHDILAQRYAFTEWKEINWDALHAEYGPRIAAAEEADDQDAYHLALREYLFAIPDGHIIFSDQDPQLWQASIGSGFGLALIELNDGRVIAHVLQDGGPAEAAGMAWGAEILEWDDVPTRSAISAVAPIWQERPPATEEGRRLLQQNLLTRAPAGAEVAVTFQNPDEAEPKAVTLTAVDDGLEPLVESLGQRGSAGIRKGIGAEEGGSSEYRPPEWHVLPEGPGYIKVFDVMPGKDDPDYVAVVGEAVREFIAQGIPGIIIDVRGNPGGIDQLVPAMMGHFFSEPDFYEYQFFDNWASGIGFLDIAIPIAIEPKEPHFAGAVAVLIDGNTVSSGEGFPMLAQRLPEGHVVGVYGTHGSFGMCCAGIRLPGDAELRFPAGQSRDANRGVQLEGDRNLQGGIVPDIRVPLTEETVYAMFVEGEDVVLQRAIEVLAAD